MNGLHKIIGIGTILIGISTTSCVMKKESDKTIETIALGVNDVNAFPYIRYNGMVNDKVFSVSESGNWTVNTYYSSNVKNFKFNQVDYELISVTQDSLKIQYRH